MERIWFLCSGGVVSGPFPTDEIQDRIKANSISAGTLIWWKGHKEWIGLNSWLENLSEILKTRNGLKSGSHWYLDPKGKKWGPLTRVELLGSLKEVTNLSGYRLWSENFNEWRSIYEYNDLVKDLGKEFRKSPRAAIVGEVQRLQSSDTFDLVMMSDGGFGVIGARDMTRGCAYQFVIKSPMILRPLQVSAEVRYISPSGGAGMQFSSVSAESESYIIDYVRKFKEGPVLPRDERGVETEVQLRNRLLAKDGIKSKWFFNRRGFQQGPLEQLELLSLLQWLENRSDIFLWTKGLKNWVSLPVFNDVLESLGLRRRTIRGPLVGRLVMIRDGVSQEFEVIGVSEVGLGLKNAGELNKNESFEGTLTSTSLSQEIPFKGRMSYVEETGYAGLEFTNISDIHRALIQKYVAQFAVSTFELGSSNTDTNKAAA